MAGGIPQQVEEFIRSTIVSIQQLEVLLLVAADEARDWTPGDVSRTLKTNTEAAAACLGSLAAAGLVVPSGEGFRYAPPADLRPVVAELALVYRTYRTRVTRLVFSQPTDSIGGFADAFRLRKRDR
ncbi:MAG TPA: hypothetical protein VFL66_03200 [Gaiellaceae bacterium]|nr:hypothetical protein [Gaiellaceae bacterium]